MDKESSTCKLDIFICSICNSNLPATRIGISEFYIIMYRKLMDVCILNIYVLLSFFMYQLRLMICNVKHKKKKLLNMDGIKISILICE